MVSHLRLTKADETYTHVTATSTATKTINSLMTLWHIDDAQPATPSGGGDTTAPSPSCRRIVSLSRPSEATFQTQLALVASYADLREDRGGEILAQLVPPIAFWSSVANLHPARNRWTIELLDTALQLAMFVEMRLKHALACRRPVELSPQVQPMILTPGHGALPSGHSTEAHMIAYVLWRLLEEAEKRKTSTAGGAATRNIAWREQLMRQAARVAINRTVAGVHFPVDSSAGQLLGLTLGEYFVHRCDSAIQANYSPWCFDGSQFPGADDFDRTVLYNSQTGARNPAAFAHQLTAVATNDPAPAPSGTPPALTPLQWLWGKARDELARVN
jgi:hypothetical protein